MVFAFTPPAVMELGNASGFNFFLQDRAGLGHEALVKARNQLLGMAAQNPAIAMLRPNGMEDTPQYRIEVDHAKAGAYGLSMSDVNDTLTTALRITSYNVCYTKLLRLKFLPRLFAENNVKIKTIPGKKIIHHAFVMYCCPDSIIAPHDGYNPPIPSPR